MLLVSFSVHAFELVMVQAVSDSKKSFVTRNGKRQGIQPGVTGTFTAENVSILARAHTVTGDFTQWVIINQDAVVPFEKGSIVTHYPANEYLWALTTETERKKYIKSEVPRIKRSLVFKGAFTRGISETVSGAPATTSRRGGYMAEIYYEKDLLANLSYDIGLRYEQEVINYSGASLVTKRNILVADLIYYFDFFRDYIAGAKFFLAGGAGFGLSNTSTVGLSQSGQVMLLPAVKMGLNLPLNDDLDFIVDGAFESLNTRERQEDTTVQSTTQTNVKLGIGLRSYF